MVREDGFEVWKLSQSAGMSLEMKDGSEMYNRASKPERDSQMTGIRLN